jgi:bifunctional non-homologous end joining protein LigD
MPTFPLPAGVIPAELPQRVQLQIVQPCLAPPDGEGGLHEIKHDGHRLMAIVSAGEVKLISRNGHDRTALFRAPFDKLVAAGSPSLVLDGEVAVPDERGLTHIDLLTQRCASAAPSGSPISPSISAPRRP